MQSILPLALLALLFDTCSSLQRPLLKRFKDSQSLMSLPNEKNDLQKESQMKIHMTTGETQTTQNLAQQLLPSLDAESIAFLSVYFVQGALGLSRLATTFLLKDELHLDPAQSAALLGITSIPWIIKPLYGFISDGIPFFGYRRRSYLLAAGFLGCLSWLTLGTFAQDTTTAILAITMGSLSIAFSDVVVDSLVVAKGNAPSPESTSSDNGGEKNIAQAADLQSLCWGTAAVGGIFSAYFSGSLLQTVTPRTVFQITAIFPLFISLASLLINEERILTPNNQSFSTFTQSLQEKIQELFKTILQPTIYLPVLFVFLWQATPSPDSAMFYFYTNELHFQPEFLGKLRLVSSIASLAGVTLYRTKLKEVPLKNVLFWTALTSVPLGLSQILLTTHINREWGVPDELFTLTDSVVLTVLGQVSFMPILALAALLCPPGVEGTLFASLMSIFNLSGTIGSELGALLTSTLGITDHNFGNLSWLIAICSVSSLLPLPFLDTLLGNASIHKVK